MKELNIQEIKPGHQIVFTCQGGHDWQRAEAREMLFANAKYTIATIDISNWSTAITLKEVPGHRFNSVLFSQSPT